MADTTEVGSIETSKLTYRRYVTFGTDEKSGKTFISKERILAETAAKDKRTGLSANWQKAEDEGFTLYSENETVNYKAKSFEGVELLTPDEAQRLYIYQVGLDSIQTARSNAFMKEDKENVAEPTPEYNQVTLDLKVGIGDEQNFSFNKAPSRKSLTDMEKLEKTLALLNLTPDQKQDLLLTLAKSQTVAEEA